MMKLIFSIVGVIVAFVLFVFGMTYFGYGLNSYFAPKYRALDNQVFKESEQYNDGMIRDLENLQMDYMKANDAQKDALRSIILHRFSVYDQNKLPPNLWKFYIDLKEGRL